MSILGLSTVKVSSIISKCAKPHNWIRRTAEALLRVSTELSVTAPIVRELKQQQLCTQAASSVLPQCVCGALLK